MALDDDRLTSQLRAVIDVTYRLEPRFDLRMPERMDEAYEQRGRGIYRGAIVPFEHRVDCIATYANFRRFETDARLVPR